MFSIPLATSILLRKLPRLDAILSKLIFSRAFDTALTALIPNLLRCSNAGVSLLDKLSLAPSIAWSTVLNSVAIFWKASELPARFIASKKSSVLILPSCTAETSSAVDMPISLATAAIPAGACSIMILKSIQATLGLLAICVAWVDRDFIACAGFSAEAARPPKAFTRLPTFLVPTASNCE